MIEIKDLLSGFRNALLSEELKKETILTILKEIARVDAKREDIEIKGDTLYLNIKPIYKNQIFMKREEILSRIRESLPKKSPGEIR